MIASLHGYDVTDPTTVSAELGGVEGFAQLSAAAHARGMGLVVDIVPNHVGVDEPEQNPWWWDVLRHGRSSAYTPFFAQTIWISADPNQIRERMTRRNTARDAGKLSDWDTYRSNVLDSNIKDLAHTVTDYVVVND